MLRAVPRRMQAPDPTEPTLTTGRPQAVEGVLGLGERMDGNGHTVLEREAAVTGEVVGVGVRLEDAHDSRAGRSAASR